MKNNRRVKKNIKLNTSVNQNQTQPGDVTQAFGEKVVILALAIAAPVFSICGALNIIFRIPDFFSYEFGRVEVARDLNLSISDTELGDFFSQFMMHKHETLDLTTKSDEISIQLFNIVETQVMEFFRTLLDQLLIYAVVSLLLLVFLIAVLQFNRMAKELRRSQNIGLIIYLVIMAAAIIYFNFSGGDIMLLNGFGGSSFGPDDLLQKMFDNRFTMNTTIAVTAVSFIIIMIIRYTVWKLTAQKGIFSEALRGVSR